MEPSSQETVGREEWSRGSEFDIPLEELPALASAETAQTTQITTSIKSLPVGFWFIECQDHSIFGVYVTSRQPFFFLARHWHS